MPERSSNCASAIALRPGPCSAEPPITSDEDRDRQDSKLITTTLRVLYRGGVGAVKEAPREIKESTVYCGRDATAQLRFDEDLQVSRRHATLRQVGGQLFIHDGVDGQPSKHGTFVNGTRLAEERRALGSGDVIRIGHSFVHVSTWPKGLGKANSLPAIHGESPEIHQLRQKVLALAAERRADGILLLGETGTGKELVAQQLHAKSLRAQGPLVICDLGRVPADRESFLSELFGHVKGAYTGADTERKGCFEEAHGGTIFLDELGELPLELQTALLRVLETKTVRKLGAPSRHIPIDVRVIAATNRDIEKEVEVGRFRSDLYARLQRCPIHLPPLRLRREDILPIVVNGLDELASLSMEPELVSALLSYSWPRNHREATVAGESLARAARQEGAERLTLKMAPSWLQAETSPSSAVVTVSSSVHPADLLGLPEPQSRLTRERLIELLTLTGGQISEVARILGSNRKFIYRRLAEFQIDYALFRKRL